MVWLNKSSRRKNMYEKEQEETVENMAVTEEDCGKPDTEESLLVENNVEEEVPAQKEEPEEEKDGMVQEEEPETEESGLTLECFAESQPEKKDRKAFLIAAAAVVVAAVLWGVCALLRKKKKRTGCVQL